MIGVIRDCDRVRRGNNSQRDVFGVPWNARSIFGWPICSTNLREQEERHAELLRQTQEVIGKGARLVRESSTLLSRPALHHALMKADIIGKYGGRQLVKRALRRLQLPQSDFVLQL
jgi:hypothetical protein